MHSFGPILWAIALRRDLHVVLFSTLWLRRGCIFLRSLLRPRRSRHCSWKLLRCVHSAMCLFRDLSLVRAHADKGLLRKLQIYCNRSDSFPALWTKAYAMACDQRICILTTATVQLVVSATSYFYERMLVLATFNNFDCDSFCRPNFCLIYVVCRHIKLSQPDSISKRLGG